MRKQINQSQTDQPIGIPIENWSKRTFPTKQLLDGTYCRLEKVEADKHLTDLYEVYGPETREENWTYLPMTSFKNESDFLTHLKGVEQSQEQVHYAIVDKESKKALGTLALMRIDQQNGTIEVGFVIYSDQLKQTRIATEAQYLLAVYVLEELGYRRYEWKCDSLNEPSRKAALRLGFTFEGIFRNALVYKNRNRDTAWFSIIDSEWPQKKARLESWLDDTNFTTDSKQKRSLAEF